MSTHEPTRQLMQVIADMLALIYDAHHKIIAFETALKDSSPEIYSRYEKELEYLRKHPRFVVNVESLSGLVQRLSDD